MAQTTGQQRAKARLKKKLKANKKIPSGEKPTRQRLRAERRRMDKIIRHAPKIDAMKAKCPGGMAAVEDRT